MYKRQDEEIPELETENLIETLKSAKENLSSLLSKYDSARVISEGADTVICGKPNAGKSSLMNLLTGTEKSIVTDIKGTTRDIVEDSVVFAGTVLHLYDTAGIHAVSYTHLDVYKRQGGIFCLICRQN